MAISLQKGQKVDLTKTNPGLTKVMVGLGWDVAGFGRNYDLDASVVPDHGSIVYFGRKTSDDGAIRHSGDNLTGAGAGDDEQIAVDLAAVSANVNKLTFIVNIYDAHSRKQDFGKVKNAFIRIVNPADNQELIRFNLTEDYSGMTAMIVGELYRHNGEWKFAAIGQGTNDGSVSEVAKRIR